MISPPILNSRYPFATCDRIVIPSFVGQRRDWNPASTNKQFDSTGAPRTRHGTCHPA